MIIISKQSYLEEAWLRFYNNYLFENGFITEEQRNKTGLKIDELYKNHNNA